MAKLKICGLTDRKDVRLAEELGADYLGFIFHPASPRFVESARVGDMGTPGESGPSRVGVFVDSPIAAVQRIFEEARLDLVQLHGGETAEYIRALGLPAWKALRARDESVLDEIVMFRDMVVLLDSYVKEREGGTGRPFDPALVRRAIDSGSAIVVAGGVSEANVTEALSLGPFGVDVNSSIEKSPGRKCEEKMRRFFEIWHTLRSGAAAAGRIDRNSLGEERIAPEKNDSGMTP